MTSREKKTKCHIPPLRFTYYQRRESPGNHNDNHYARCRASFVPAPVGQPPGKKKYWSLGIISWRQQSGHRYVYRRRLDACVRTSAFWILALRLSMNCYPLIYTRIHTLCVLCAWWYIIRSQLPICIPWLSLLPLICVCMHISLLPNRTRWHCPWRASHSGLLQG